MADREVTVGIGPDGTVRLRRKIAGAQKLIKQIGAMIARDARQAFTDQRFGDHVWPEKYPNQTDDPFISIAGVVQDFSEGNTKPRSETFERRPALQRTATLSRTISHQLVGEDGVEIGTETPYASLHQSGGQSEQDVTDNIKHAIDAWLGKSKKKKVFAPDDVTAEEFDAWAKANGYVWTKKTKKRSESGNETVSENPNERYRRKLNFLLAPGFNKLETEVNRRPFLGITKRRAETIEKLLADYLGDSGVTPVVGGT